MQKSIAYEAPEVSRRMLKPHRAKEKTHSDSYGRQDSVLPLFGFIVTIC